VQGGIPGAANLGDCAALESIVRRHALKGRLYAAICAAPPLALARWGLLNGLKVVIHATSVSSSVGSTFISLHPTALVFNLLLCSRQLLIRRSSMSSRPR
jgi:hypothetical protein